MALILNIETATKVCAVTLAKDGSVILTKSIKSEKYSHSENLNFFIQAIFNETEFTMSQLEAVAVSEGPGSYTGLRIGVSTAKGLCYALDIPLIAINSLKALANQVKGNYTNIIPLFDARRMEVYSAVFDAELNEKQPVDAVVVDESSYADYIANGSTLFLGPGAEKCQSVWRHPNVNFDLETEVSSEGMVTLSEIKYSSQEFEDVAYFEPYYLKAFIAGKPKKMF